MARGWESKSIEAQQEEKARGSVRGPALTDAQRVAAHERRTLELARLRAADDLSRATSPAHREMLESALRALDDRLRELDKS